MLTKVKFGANVSFRFLKKQGNKMNRIISLIMYVLWILTIIIVLATTFTNFQYEDLNALAVVLFVFALLNSILVFKARRK